MVYKNGHNFATGLPIDVLFGSRVGGVFGDGRTNGATFEFQKSKMAVYVALLSRVTVASAGLSCQLFILHLQFGGHVRVHTVGLPFYCSVSACVTGRWVCDDRFYGLVNRSNR